MKTNHYFTESPDTPHDLREVTFAYRGHALRFATDADTFSRERLDPGSALLLNSIGELTTGLCADVGCGWGALGIALAAANPQARLVLLDINRRAVDLAQQNIAANRVANARAMASDGLCAIEEPLDHVICNPPIRAGKAVVYAIFAQAHEKLRAGGSLTIVMRKAQGAPSAKEHLRELFGHCETIARGAGYHILQCRKERSPANR